MRSLEFWSLYLLGGDSKVDVFDFSKPFFGGSGTSFVAEMDSLPYLEFLEEPCPESGTDFLAPSEIRVGF